MKTNKLYILLIAIIFLGCSQDLDTIEPIMEEVVVPPTPDSGTADFSKFVAIGNSLTAGYQAGALFTEGQENSLPKIMNDMFSMISGATGGGAFNQPDINSELGFSGFDPGTGTIFGRLLLQGNPPIPTPQPGGDFPGQYTEGLPLNNFGVPGILLGQFLSTDTGNPGSPLYNPLWARFASDPLGNSIMDDVIAAQPTFFLFWLGNNDALGYAVSGASNEAIFTDPATFGFLYNTAIGAITTFNPNAKGVVCNIPGVLSAPFFTLIPWNPIPLDAATAAGLNDPVVGLGGINLAVQGALGLGMITQEEADLRTLNWQEGANGALIWDDDLVDLSPLGVPATHAKARLTNANDLFPLTISSVLGVELVPGVSATTQGVSLPLGDEGALTANEIVLINDRIDAFNTIIKSTADANNLAHVDINSQFASLLNNPIPEDGLIVNGTIAPPYAGISEDGIHPNSRGYALLAKWIIREINTEFGAVVPEPDLADYKGTALPIQ